MEQTLSKKGSIEKRTWKKIINMNRYNQGFPATSEKTEQHGGGFTALQHDRNSYWLYHLNIFNEDLRRKISLLRFVKDGKRLLGLQLKSKKQTISHQELEKGVICVKATAKLSIVASTAESSFAFATLNIPALDVKLQCNNPAPLLTLQTRAPRLQG
ncbi:hypothetical protein J6590_047656 [Homalodisca vitripennis]|nr:hypothetical protein J6590_047656 [Homalodisca vitripennis]